MIDRSLSSSLRDLATGFRGVYVGGPRQSGKTTLLKATFPNLPYSNLENLDIRQAAEDDPRAFLARFPDGAILDEVQRVPILFNYLQEVLDNTTGFFALSGSQNFLLMSQITQSLAGRVAILTLHPLSYAEIPNHQTLLPEEAILQGGYPRQVAYAVDSAIFYDSYVQTYIERDVRELAKVIDLSNFSRFIKLCAARTGQLLNFSSLAADCDIAVNTAKNWYSILEASYLVFRLEPYYKNYNKRISKSPKHYFIDTGLVCHLLGIQSVEELRDHYLFGQLAETYLISERVKQYTNAGRKPEMAFFRESNQHEIDLLEQLGKEHPTTWELKSSRTGNLKFFKVLKWWQELTGSEPSKSGVVYFGNEDLPFKHGRLISWHTWLGNLPAHIGHT